MLYTQGYFRQTRLRCCNLQQAEMLRKADLGVAADVKSETPTPYSIKSAIL